MLRHIGAFLLIFAFLGLIVHITGVVELFGGAAVGLFGIDLALAYVARNADAIKASEDLLL